MSGTHVNAVGTAPLVGRSRYRELLAEQLGHARSGRAAVVLLTGPPGIGKTRLLEELTLPELAGDATVLRGSASQAEGMPPYLPFLEALGAHITAAPLDALRAQVGGRASLLAGMFPEIVERLGAPEPMYPLPPEQERFRLFEAVAGLMAAIAAVSPVLLLLDDLQWADAATCDLLVHIASRVRNARLLIVGGYREGEAGENPVLTRALAELNRRRLLVNLELPPLEYEESLTLATELLGGKIGEEAARVLHEHSEGIPFFLEELIRALIEDGALVRQDEIWRLSTRPETLLPPRVAEAVRMRLARLDPAVVDLLRVAAVTGRTWKADLIARGAGMETEQAEELVLAAVRAHLVRPGADDNYAFAHHMVRETLYAEIGRERRRRLHLAIGEALASAGPADTPGRLADLAFHFGQAGEPERGVTYALAAGRHALHTAAAVEAMAHFRMALRLLGEEDGGRQTEALLGLGEAAMRSGDYPQAARAYEAVRDALLVSEDREGAGRAARQLGRAWWRLEAGTDAASAFAQAIELAGPGDSREAAEALLELADLAVTSLGRYAEGLETAERALAMVERLGDARLEARAYCVAGNLRARSNKTAAGRAALDRALELAEAIDDPALAATACAYLANIAGWTGDLSRSRELTIHRAELAGRSQDPYELRDVYSWLGLLDALQGRWAEAEHRFDQQERLVTGLQSGQPLVILQAARALMYYYQGRFGEAEQGYRQTVAFVRHSNPGALVWYLGQLGLVLIELDRRDEALEVFTELRTLADPLDSQSSSRLCAFTHLAVGYVRIGAREQAAQCHDGLLPFGGLFAPIPVDRALGLAALARGDRASAGRYLADAEAQARRAGMRPELALILLERGQLEAHTRSGGRSGSGPTGRIAEGWSLCAELGMEALGQAVLGGMPAAAHVRVAGLTERELEVLRLVVQGRTNREIAKTLFLSEHTVARHLTHIFTKIGVENRAGAAAFALRHDLTHDHKN